VTVEREDQWENDGQVCYSALSVFELQRGDLMTVIIDFAPDEEARLRERATAAGKDVRTFVREAALEKVDRPTLAELLAPIHAATAKTAATVEEIDAMADRARDEVRRERRVSANHSAP
jgi:hypothetical protein